MILNSVILPTRYYTLVHDLTFCFDFFFVKTDFPRNLRDALNVLCSLVSVKAR